MKKIKLVSYVLFSTMLIGCGGGGGGGSTPVNIAPEATDKTITLNENKNKQVVLEARDADGNTLTYKVVKAPSHGIFKNGVYTPTANYVGTDSFTFIANDGTVDSQPATITITITADFDGDDISDAIDTDDDNDGVADTEDALPLNPAETIDTDNDGIGNNADTDDDGDGVIDINDVFPLDSTESVDTDNDGIGNNADTDDDNDGISDVDETIVGTNPLDATSTPDLTDTDGDGSIDAVDTDDDNDGVLDVDDAFPLDGTESVDTDGDGIGNNADTDDDNDGISDVDETIVGTNPLDATSTPDLTDTDGDGHIDAVDTDDDNDGVLDVDDAFPLDGTESIDTDGDGIGNNADTDDDNDGVSDTDETIVGTNPLDATSTPNLTDTDGDGSIDAVDTDDDNDGVLDVDDAFPLDGTESVDTDGDGIGNNADTDDDNDGVSDVDETIVGTNPLDATSTPNLTDTDGDGSIDTVDTDDDNDSVLDVDDAFPLDGTESVDTDGDGIGNNADTDDDNDGMLDTDEVAFGSDPLDATSKAVTISGKITYDLIPVNSSNNGLDYNNISQKSVKNIKVDILDASNNILETITTDNVGDYSVSLLSNKDVKVRVYAKMIKTGTPSWDVKVVDNTNADALYVMEGTLTTTGLSNSTRNLNAASGAWDGTAYTSTRTAAPFAILDSINSAMEKVLSADALTVFEPLVVNWSIKNTTSGGSLADGQIGTSFYTDGKLYILGDANGDTDEYDDHVIAHEWGHYYEDKFSRSDSIGGSHGSDDTLDIRVAFGEGWGNAFSAMALDNSIYFDTTNNSGWSMDIEDATHTNAGWFSEGSIQRILYDLYDSSDDTNGNDSVSLGFAPIHQVFIGAQKVTPAFTSIFSFIKALKDENVGEQGDIDTIVSSESIATITDIYGTGRTNRVDSYPYHDLTVGSSVNVATSNSDGSSNKLSNHQYVKFTIGTAGTYVLKVEQTNGTDSDPDFNVYKTSPFEGLYSVNSSALGVEESSKTFEEGNYLMDIMDYRNIANAEYTVTVTPQ